MLWKLHHYFDQVVKNYPLDMDDPVLKEVLGATEVLYPDCIRASC